MASEFPSSALLTDSRSVVIAARVVYMTTNTFVAESVVSADSLLSVIEANTDSDGTPDTPDFDTADSGLEFSAFDGTPDVGDTVRVKVKNAGIAEGVVDYSGGAYFQVEGWGIFTDSVESIEKAA